MHNQRKDLLKINRFKVEIDGINHMGICEIKDIETLELIYERLTRVS